MVARAQAQTHALVRLDLLVPRVKTLFVLPRVKILEFAPQILCALVLRLTLAPFAKLQFAHQLAKTEVLAMLQIVATVPVCIQATPAKHLFVPLHAKTGARALLREFAIALLGTTEALARHL